MRFQRSVLIYVTLVLLAGLALLGYSSRVYPLTASPSGWLLFAGLIFLVALSDRHGLPLTSRTNVHVDTIPILVGVLIFNPAMALLMAGVGRFLGRIDRRIAPAERMFNVGQTLVYVGIGSLLLHTLTPTPWLPEGVVAWWGALAAMTAMFLLNTLIVAGIAGIDSHTSPVHIWFAGIRKDAIEHSVMFGFGLLAALVVVPYPWALALMALPAIVVFVTLDRTLKMEARQKQLAETNAGLAADLSAEAAQLRDAQAVLEDALAAKNQMLQNVSHELRTPMVTVSGYTEALVEGFYGDLSSPQLGALGIILRSTQNMIRLVNDLISLQALDRGTLEVAEVELETILENCRDAFAPRAAARGIRLGANYDGKLPVLYADGCRLEQVIGNLLDNAIKFSPDGGDIWLRAHCLDGLSVQVSVADEGIGIPMEELPNIYNRFYQVDGSSRRRFGGQGLGLAIAKRIVELHGGAIVAESEVGRGTTFHITLPLTDSPSGPGSFVLKNLPATGGCRPAAGNTKQARLGESWSTRQSSW